MSSQQIISNCHRLIYPVTLPWLLCLSSHLLWFFSPWFSYSVIYTAFQKPFHPETADPINMHACHLQIWSTHKCKSECIAVLCWVAGATSCLGSPVRGDSTCVWTLGGRHTLWFIIWRTIFHLKVCAYDSLVLFCLFVLIWNSPVYQLTVNVMPPSQSQIDFADAIVGHNPYQNS